MQRRDFLNKTKAGLFISATMPFLITEIIKDTPKHLKNENIDIPKELKGVSFSDDGKIMTIYSNSTKDTYELNSPFNLSTRVFKFRKLF